MAQAPAPPAVKSPPLNLPSLSWRAEEHSQHLQTWLPKFVQSLKARGAWNAYLAAWDAQTYQMFSDLIDQGLQGDQIEELLRDRIYPAPADAPAN